MFGAFQKNCLFVCTLSLSNCQQYIFFFCFYNFRTELTQCGFIPIRLSNHYMIVNELYSKNTFIIIFKIRLKYFPQNQRSSWCIWHSPKVCTCRRRIACFFFSPFLNESKYSNVVLNANMEHILLSVLFPFFYPHGSSYIFE